MRFARQGWKLILATCVSQGAVALSSPLLGRLYDPRDFGVFAVVNGLVMVLASVATLRFDLAISVPASQVDAAKLALASLAAAGLVTVLTAVAAAGWTSLEWGGAHAPYVWFVPPLVLVAGVSQTFVGWAVRMRHVDGLANSRFAQAGGLLTTQVGLGLRGAGPAGLLLGLAVGYAACSAALVRPLWRQWPGGVRSARAVLATARGHRDYPLFATPAALLGAASLQLPALVLAPTFGAAVAGWVAMSQKAIGAPMSLVGQAIAQLYVGEATKLARDEPEKLPSLFWGWIARLGLVGAPPFLVVAIWGPSLFGFVFGEPWREAGVYARMLALPYFLRFASTPLNQTLNILGRQRQQLGWDAARLALLGAALVGPWMLGYSARHAVMLYCLASTGLYSVFLVLAAAAARAASERTAVGATGAAQGRIE